MTLVKFCACCLEVAFAYLLFDQAPRKKEAGTALGLLGFLVLVLSSLAAHIILPSVSPSGWPVFLIRCILYGIYIPLIQGSDVKTAVYWSVYFSAAGTIIDCILLVPILRQILDGTYPPAGDPTASMLLSLALVLGVQAAIYLLSWLVIRFQKNPHILWKESAAFFLVGALSLIAAPSHASLTAPMVLISLQGVLFFFLLGLQYLTAQWAGRKGLSHPH